MGFLCLIQKIGLIKILTHQAMLIYPECKLDAELKMITDSFFANGYIENVILNNIKSTFSYFHNSKIFGTPKCPFTLWIESRS